MKTKFSDYNKMTFDNQNETLGFADPNAEHGSSGMFFNFNVV
jgi:hypothetical protein